MIKRVLKAILPEYSDEQQANSSYRFSLKFFINIFWLFACTYTVYYFEIEKNKGFEKVVLVITAAFLLYIFTPLKFRKLFLVLLAAVVEAYLFGVKISVSVSLFIIYFVALTYVKNKVIRNLLVIFSVLACMAITSKFIVMPFARIVVMFGALFLMLRYIYLLYELNYLKNPPIFIERLCYLFLIPNSCFPLFPALSPVEYIKSYYNEAAEVSFAKGLSWITIGIFHLLLYRVIYLYFSPSPYDIDGFGIWIWFILSSYSVIFQLSGLFYLATGFLQIFGFKLSPIFNHVYLANGFTDLWRRVNLYWREFMIRIFYYPLLFKFKKYNSPFLVFIITLSMFVFTWLLHSWQWYWIKGTYYFFPNDFIFWFIIGVFVSGYSYVSLVRWNKNNQTNYNENYFLSAAKVILMFFCMSFLWSFWTASSITEFLYILKFSWHGTINEYFYFVGILVFILLLAGLVRRLHFKHHYFDFIFKDIRPGFAISFCVIVIGFAEIMKKNSFEEQVENFISMNMNNYDKASLERGYYEQILNTDSKSIDLLNANSKLKKWNLDRDAYQKTKNELGKEFKPNYTTTFKGDTLFTNNFGIRDKNYSIKKPENTLRFAFVGGSYVMGSGVSNEENFSALIENKLNNSVNSNVEILNFGVGGYFLIQNVFIVEHRISQYHPDYLFCFIHSSYRTRCIDNYANLLQKKVEVTSPFLKSISEKAGIKEGMCHLEIYNRLKPYVNEIFTWGYKTMFDVCKKENIEPVIVYLPINATLSKDEDKEFCMQEATKTGFKIIDLSEVYFGNRAEEIQLSSWDTHPNEKGHRLISDLLFEKMKKDKHFFKFMP